jgi:hypothetical protein
MFMTCLHTTFQLPNSDNSSVKPIDVKLKAKEKFRTAAMWLFLHSEKNYLKMNCIFCNDKRLCLYRPYIK